MEETDVITLANNEKYDHEIYSNIDQCAHVWDALCDDDVYFRSAYLKLLESQGPIDYKYYYVIVSQYAQPIGVLYCQRKTIKLAEDFRIHTHSKSWWEKTKVAGTKWLFTFVKHEMLICGNVLLTGEYGFQFPNLTTSDDLVSSLLEGVKDYIRSKEKIKVKSLLVKDFHSDKAVFKKRTFKSKEYYAFKVQPDMIVPLREEWASYADYLSSVKSKYRVKFKKIKKKGSALNFRMLSEEEAELYDQDMYKMYRDTADRATFNLFTLDKHYFSELKKLYKEELTLTGVFLEDKLVAFFTLIKNGEIADAHFLGYNVQLNSKFQLYFNILLVLVEQAIASNARYLNLSRTALEIKSSVGAEPHDLYVHLRYHNDTINQWVPSILKKFVPEEDWLPRSPFK
jgi:hypothetical protein